MSSPQQQLSLFSSLSVQPDVQEAIETMANTGAEVRGAVFTRRQVVDFMLDLVGYTSQQPLFQKNLLEPSFGEGDFLLAAVERLLQSWTNFKQKKFDTVEALLDRVRAVEVHRETFFSTRQRLLELLSAHKLKQEDALKLVDAWLIQGDFLLTDTLPAFDFIVGNPPYVRQERISQVLLSVYRERYSTLFDRADLYIPFIERSLALLAPGGHLSFICSDRWIKNRYGGPLRKMVSENYHLKFFVDMVDTPAFHTDVIAYPAITIIARQLAGTTRIAHQPKIDEFSLKELTRAFKATTLPENSGVRELKDVVNDSAPWILEPSDQLAIVRRLEQKFPSLEEVGCKVGIGVATGADKAFIGPFEELEVESDRKLPLVTTKDILTGEVKWQGLGVINPFQENGQLVNLVQFPMLRSYLEERKEVIANRHCARKSPGNWYRTIDRIHLDLVQKPKLLIPDIKGDANIVYEPGGLYPHHNLYYIISNQWDLRALHTVLRSGIATLFISAYSTKMRGGYLRFQAQYLRRIRLPFWQNVPEAVQKMLISSFEEKDTFIGNQAVLDLFELTKKEQQLLNKN